MFWITGYWCGFSWEGEVCYVRGMARGMPRMLVAWMAGPRPSNRSRFIASLSHGWEFRAAPVSSLKKGRGSQSHQELGFPLCISRGPEGPYPFFPYRPESPKACILRIYPSHKLLPVGLAWNWGTPQLATGCCFFNQVTTLVWPEINSIYLSKRIEHSWKIILEAFVFCI